MSADHKAKPLTRREVLNQCASIRADGHEPLTLAVEPEILLATLDAQDELLARLAVVTEAARGVSMLLTDARITKGGLCTDEYVKEAQERLASAIATPEAETRQATMSDPKPYTTDEMVNLGFSLPPQAERVRATRAALDASKAREAELMGQLAMMRKALELVKRAAENHESSDAEFYATEALAATPEALTTWRDERDAAAFARGVEAAIAKVEAQLLPGTSEMVHRGRLVDALRSLIPSTNKESGR